MEMRAQDLSLKLQFDGLRQELRTLKEEYDEYNNCEYYDEHELVNIEYLNYNGKKSLLATNALREDSGYHSDTSSLSEPKDAEKKVTNYTTAKYLYQPVPSFPKLKVYMTRIVFF
ncbi:hypothetical protein QZH41_005050 [Actinostola sp. cb2023]|nr:hypothetical protein QZH41_005050 [Actinostola sp. cb2023]